MAEKLTANGLVVGLIPEEEKAPKASEPETKETKKKAAAKEKAEQ